MHPLIRATCSVPTVSLAASLFLGATTPSALAIESSWDSCLRVFAPTPTLGDIPVYTVCQSRTLPGDSGTHRALGFFAPSKTGIPDRAFLVALSYASDCTPSTPNRHQPIRCREERWESKAILDPETLSRGEIRELGADPRPRAWTFSPGAFTRKLPTQGAITIEAQPRDAIEAQPRRSEARWEKLGPRARRVLLETSLHQVRRQSGRSLASTLTDPGCWEIPLLPVTPVKRTTRLSEADSLRKATACDGRSREACLHVTLEQKFEPSRRIPGALRLAHAPGSIELENDFRPLLGSPAIRDILRLRKFVRKRTGSADACKPIVIAVARKGEELGTGPALLNGMHFELDGRRHDELIALESASLAGQKILTMPALRKHGIDDLVIAHELAHGMMQELYGTEDFAALVTGIHSREGHNASATTDPALAWIEGFAEAFEAHYGLQNSGDRIDPLWAPELQSALGFIEDRTREMAKQDDFSTVYYLGFVGAVLDLAGGMLSRFDLLMAELLKLERQDPIRNAFYVVSTRFGNLPIQLDNDSPMLAPHGIVESLEELASREGIIAHFVYLLLHKGHARPLLETIRMAKPANGIEFLNAFARLEPKVWRESGLASRVADLLDRGTREALAEQHMHPLASSHAARFGMPQSDAPWILRAGDTAAPAPALPMPAPRTGWIEFKTPSRMRTLLQGSMDRIDLMTAPVERLTEVFHLAIADANFDDSRRASAASRLAASWLEHRRGLLPDNLDSRLLGRPAFGALRDEEIDAWTRTTPLIEEQILRRRVAGFLHRGRECFLARCETPEI